MKKYLQKNTYSQLVKDITELYDYARRALVEAIGRSKPDRVFRQSPAHEENLQHAAKLTWTQHVALLLVKNGNIHPNSARRKAKRQGGT